MKDAWIEALQEVLLCVPRDIRLDVLRHLIDAETENQNSQRRFPNSLDLNPSNWSRMNKAKSLIIQVLARAIINSHSPEGAAQILFRHHRNGTGTGWLPDYLDQVPGIFIDRKHCQQIADRE